MNIRICPSGRFPFAVPFAGGCCGSGCVSVSGNRQPCDDSFCTSCILASICFCLSVSASTLACLRQVVASEYFPAVNASSARLRSFSIFSCFSRASFVFLSLAVPGRLALCCGQPCLLLEGFKVGEDSLRFLQRCGEICRELSVQFHGGAVEYERHDGLSGFILECLYAGHYLLRTVFRPFS